MRARQRDTLQPAVEFSLNYVKKAKLLLVGTYIARCMCREGQQLLVALIASSHQHLRNDANLRRQSR